MDLFQGPGGWNCKFDTSRDFSCEARAICMGLVCCFEMLQTADLDAKHVAEDSLFPQLCNVEHSILGGWAGWLKFQCWFTLKKDEGVCPPLMSRVLSGCIDYLPSWSVISSRTGYILNKYFCFDIPPSSHRFVIQSDPTFIQFTTKVQVQKVGKVRFV